MSRASQLPTVAALYKAGKIQAASQPAPKTYPHLADRIALVQGDITKLQVDAIVNAGKNSLLGGGGVDGAIHSAAGPKLLEECRTLNGCETGDAKATKGYNLPAKYVIHTVGPVYAKTKVEEKRAQLQSAYRRSLQEASRLSDVKSVAFPSISTGVYGYPIGDATEVAIETVAEWLDSSEGKKAGVEQVVFCTFSKADHDVYLEKIPNVIPEGQ